MERVGYIGLGIMGAAIARNLMKAGFPLVVHNRSQAIVNQLVHEGATAAYSPKEVAQQVDIIFTNLPDSPDVEQVALDPHRGILAGHMRACSSLTTAPSSPRRHASLQTS